MDALTLEQAARTSGRGARELRLAIEAGDLPASQRGGRWLVDPVDLEQLVLAGDPPTGPRLVPAPTPGEPGSHSLDELLARLEARAVEVAALREELEAARRRIRELEGAPPADGPGMRDALTPLFERTRPLPPSRG